MGVTAGEQHAFCILSKYMLNGYSVSVCTATNSIRMTVDTLRLGSAPGPLIPFSVQKSLLLYVPLLATNIFATLLMCSKAWYVHSRLPLTSTS